RRGVTGLPYKRKSPRKIPRRFRNPIKLRLRHAERFQGWLVHRAGRFETLRGLILRQCRARLRSKNAVDFALIVTLLLKCGLHIGYHLPGILFRIRSVNRSIIIIDRVGSITPRWVPVIIVPEIPATENKHDVVVMRSPPPLVMPLWMIILENDIL